MNFARLESSPRLQRVLAALRGAVRLSTREIIERANVCAVNSCVAELAANGYRIDCTREGAIWFYRLVEPVQRYEQGRLIG